MKRIYLDHNATTPLKADVCAAMFVVMCDPLNASALHREGAKARSLVEESRRKLLTAINAPEGEVIFTSSGTEANNLILKGTEAASVIISSVEHASIYQSVPSAIPLPVDGHGVVIPSALEEALKTAPKPCLVSVMLANNETGAIQPLREITRIAHAHDALVHTDAAQAFGKVVVDMQKLGVDAITLSAHKIGAPQGAAALVLKKGAFKLSPQLTGGGQEKKLRAGTENVAAIHGFGVAASSLREDLEKMNAVAELRYKLEDSLQEIAPHTKIFSEGVDRLPNTSYITMPSVRNETQLIHFDTRGIAVSTGSACSSGRLESSHVLKAMGVPEETGSTAIRVSLGLETTIEDIEHFIVAWKELYVRSLARTEVA